MRNVNTIVPPCWKLTKLTKRAQFHERYSCSHRQWPTITYDEVSQSETASTELQCNVTGYPSLPPDVTTKMYVKKLENHPNKVLAEASTCSMELFIPIVHKEYSVFKEYLTKSISYGKIGF